MKHTAVVSFHTNPYTCGVARFNQSLARTMGVPVVPLDDYLARGSNEPVLLSIKLEEISPVTLNELHRRLDTGILRYDLYVHGVDGSQLESLLISGANRVFGGSAEITAKIRDVRADATSVFAPGAPVLPRQAPVDCTLLTFGMAHKIRSDGYRKLAGVMEGDPRSFRLEISTALHEGGSFDESFFTVGDEISAAFSGNVRFLGFLADAEVSQRLREVDALVAFFPRGVRENNTTVLSAMTHGCPVITNLDESSPAWMVHGATILDVASMTKFPDDVELRRIGDAGMHVAREYSFEHLVRIISSP